MAVAKFGGIPGPRGARGPAGPTGSVLDGVSVAAYGTSGNGVTVDTAAVQRAADSSADNVYFPPGRYKVGAVTFSKDDQTITFAPGASLELAATSAVVFSGARQRIVGLVAVVEAASETAGTLVTVSGVGSLVDGVRFNVEADVPNVTPLKVQADRIRVYDYKLVGAGKTFKYAVHAIAAGGGPVDCVLVDGLDIDVGDDGANASFGALVYLRALRSEISDLSFDGGGRSLFPDGVVIIEGGKNTLRRPKIFASAATYGIHLKAGSEFFEIYGGHIQGRNNSTYQANSCAIYCAGNFAGGHLKTFQTSLTGFTDGIVMMGGADTPMFVGTTIANNQNYAVVIDTAGAGGLFISAMSFDTCYLGDVTQLRAVHFKSGNAAGVHFKNCQIGVAEGQVGCYVDPAFASLTGVVFTGGRILGASGGSSEYAFEPSANTGVVLFQNTALHSIAALGTGTYASKCQEALTPELTSLVIGTKDAAGTSNNRMTDFLTDVYTANFGTVNAGATVPLTFAFSGIPSINTCTLETTMSTALGAKAQAGIVFQWWLNGLNEIAGSATNITGSPIASVTGGVRFAVTVFG
jgi:hypothetical protein